MFENYDFETDKNGRHIWSHIPPDIRQIIREQYYQYKQIFVERHKKYETWEEWLSRQGYVYDVDI
jgi:hypothetical protein